MSGPISPRHRCSVVHRILILCALFVCLLGHAKPAHAYAWMIHHGYSACSACHADPSGGGLLTPYGRAQGENLLRSHYSSSKDDTSNLGGFLFGAIDTGDRLLLGGDYRGAYYTSKIGATPYLPTKYLQMQADFAAQLSLGRFRANGSIGYDHQGAELADVTLSEQNNVVSRVHWLGLALGSDDEVLVRAGRMNVPYGIRSIEHTLFIHSPQVVRGGGVRDDLNDGQQHGVSISYVGDAVRGELMAILGNYQLSPDVFRERGYSGYLEWAPGGNLALGASSLVTHTNRDIYYAVPMWRHAHGVFARYSPWDPLTLLSEVDFLLNSSQPLAINAGVPANQAGYASFLQADFEVWQGLHFMLTGESTLPATHKAFESYSAWGSVAWFFAPHADIRFDAIKQSVGVGRTALPVTTLIGQLHVYL